MGDPSLYESKEYRYYTWYGGSYGPVWLSEISCHGNESNLSQCKVGNPVDVLCSYANGVVEVMCRPRNYTARKFHLQVCKGQIAVVAVEPTGKLFFAYSCW